MKIASIADVKAKLSSYVTASGQSPVVITRNGKAVAAIVPITDEQDLEGLVLSYSPKFRSIISEANRQLKGGLGIPNDQFWTEVDAPSRRKSTRSK
jgi:prevent-host-death family protein